MGVGRLEGHAGILAHEGRALTRTPRLSGGDGRRGGRPVAGQRLPALETLRAAVDRLPADAPPADRARVVGALGHVLMLMLRWGEAQEALQEALALATEAGAGLERARTLISLGAAASEGPEPELAVAYLKEGRALALELGALDEVLRSHVNLGEILDRLERLDEAIADGLEGFRLATRGRMTVEAAQIGEQLYMSEKTASVHISRILTKLDARGRVEAASLAHRLGLLDEPEKSS